MTNRLEYSLMVLAVAGLGFYALYDPLVQREQSSEKLAPTRDGGTTVPDWARGLNDLGVMYLNGRGVQPDLAAAFAFFSAAAEGGDPLAMNNLGWIYQNGLGLEADQKKAKELYARAAQIFNKLASSNSL